MSLDATRLKGAIDTAIITALGTTDAAGLAAWSSISQAIATAVVNEITANAVVVPTALVAPSGGGPVSGVGNIT